MTDLTDTERPSPTKVAAVQFSPLTMPKPSKTLGITLAPSVGWHAACATCGENLTEHGTEYVGWFDADAAETDADSWYFETCPRCGAEFGERAADDD